MMNGAIQSVDMREKSSQWCKALLVAGLILGLMMLASGVYASEGTEFEAAVVERAALLVGVPFFLGHPAAAFGAEVQHGPFDCGAGKDAVAAAEFAVEGGFVDVAGVAVEDFGAVDGVDGEAAQAAAQVAPGVQVPVVPVMHQALR